MQTSHFKACNIYFSLRLVCSLYFIDIYHRQQCAIKFYLTCTIGLFVFLQFPSELLLPKLSRNIEPKGLILGELKKMRRKLLDSFDSLLIALHLTVEKCLKDADRTVNSADPDQTALTGSV